MARLTYGELRSNAEKIADEVVKERVLAGIEVLNDKYGPDWVDKVDPATLCVSSTIACVLGQVYHDAEVPAKRWRDMVSDDGYWRGLLILNGEVEEHPEQYGFAADDEEDDDYRTLTSAWRVALGDEA